MCLGHLFENLDCSVLLFIIILILLFEDED